MSLLLSGPLAKPPSATGITDLNDVEPVIWLDMTDFTYQKQDTAGTVDVTTTGQDVEYLVDRSVNGNDFEALDGLAGISASGSLDFNGIKFGPDAALTGLTNNMEVYALVNTSDTIWPLLGKQPSSSHAIVIWSGQGTDPQGGFAGTLVYSTNGVDLVAPTRDDLFSEWSIGANVVAGVRGLDLSAATDATMAANLLPLSFHGSIRLDGNALHFVLLDGTRPGIVTERAQAIDRLKSLGGIA